MKPFVDGLFSIEGKVAVVTGGSQGIGRMIATGLVDAGARVYISSRKADVCEEVASELSERGTCVAFPLDLSTAEGAQVLAEQVSEREDRVDILVHNAGAIWEAGLDEYPMSAFDKLWAINVKSVFLLTQFLLPRLRASATVEDPARIINIGSIDGLRVPLQETYAYSASKAAEHMLSQHLAVRLGRENITVNVICPGLFVTRMTQPILGSEDGRLEMIRHSPVKRVGIPDDVAGAVIFLASRAGAYVNGAILTLDGGMGLMPG